MIAGEVPFIRGIFPRTPPNPDGWSDYTFYTNTDPPRYAQVSVGLNPNTPNITEAFADGPYDEEQLGIVTRRDPARSPEDRDITYANRCGWQFVDMADVQLEGDYPGGPDRLARNLAALVLAANPSETL